MEHIEGQTPEVFLWIHGWHWVEWVHYCHDVSQLWLIFFSVLVKNISGVLLRSSLVSALSQSIDFCPSLATIRQNQDWTRIFKYIPVRSCSTLARRGWDLWNYSSLEQHCDGGSLRGKIFCDCYVDCEGWC